MSDDTDFNFDTKKARDEVESMTKALDKLMVAVNKLDKSELSKVQQELDRFTNSGSTAAAQMQRRIGGAIDELNKKLSTTGRVDYGIVKEIRTMQAKAVAELQAGVKNMAMVNAEMRINLQTQWKHINATALEEAKKLGNTFTDLSSLTAKNVARPQSKMTEDDVRALLGMPDRASMKTFAAQIKAEMQASVAADKQATSDRLANIAAIGNAWKLSRASQEASITAELSTAKAQAVADKQITADRLANIAAIGNAWKLNKASMSADVNMELAAARSQAVADKQITTDRLNNIKAIGNVWKMMSAQIKSEAKAMATAEVSGANEAIAAHERHINILNARIAASNKAALAAKTANIGTTGMTLGGAEIVGQYTPFNAIRTKPSEVEALSNSFRKLTIEGNDVHSMARGLASGFNLLWLTWGNLLPLFTGAGISFGLKKTFDIGSEVEYLIKFMETLGQTVDHTGKKMEYAGTIIRQELRNIDQTTMFSLTELSKAMVTLGQAGLSPAEALKTLRPAADLAAVGMVDLKTTTDLLIQTNALFNLSSEKTATTAAKIFQITKSGVLNVEDIAGSMRYASEANTRFGKSLEETLTLLGALAQAGLKGSSGGTALINFYRDLNGRSSPAIAAMKQLEAATGATIKVFDKLGNQRSGIDIFNDINEAAKRLKAQDADKLLSKIFSDRGGRTFFAMVRDGTIDLKKMQEQLEKTDPASLFEAAKGMMDTTRGALNILQGALVGSLDQVFEAYSGKFKGFIQDITKIVDSNEFKLAVAGIIDGVSRIYNIVKDNAGVIATFFGAWAGIKVIGAGIAIFQGLATVLAGLAPTLAMTTGAYVRQTLAVQTNSLAIIENVAANRAAASGMTATAAAATGAAAASRVAAVSAGVAGVAMRGLGAVIGFLANPLVGIIATVGMLGYAFLSTKNNAEAGMSGTANAVTANGAIIESQLLKEISLARQRNAIVAGGAFATEEAKIDQMSSDNAKRARQVQFLLEKADNEKFSEATRAESRTLAQKEIATMQANEAIINKAREEINMGKLDAVKRQEEQERKARADGEKLAARAKAEANATALKNGGGVGGRQDFGKFKLAQDNELSILEKGMNDRLSTLKKGYDNEKQLTDARYNAGITTQGQYEAKVLSQTLSFEKKSIDVINNSTEEYLAAYNERYSEISEKLDLARSAKNTFGIEQLSAALDNLNRSKDAFVSSNLEKKAQIEDTAITRMRMSVIKAEGDLVKLTKTTDDYWLKDRQEKAKSEQLQLIADKYRFINESLLSSDAARKAAEEAGVNEAQKHVAVLEDLNTKLNEAEQYYQDYAVAILESGQYQTEEGQNSLKLLQERIDKLKELISISKTNAGTATEYASQVAYSRTIKAQQDSLTKSVSEGIVTGLVEGGEAGKKKLRDLVVSELRKPITLAVQAFINPIMAGAFNMLGLNSGMSGAGGGGLNSLLGIGQQAYSLYNGYNAFTSGQGILGSIGSWLGFGSGTGAGAAATAVNGLSALQPVTIATNSSYVAPVVAGQSGVGGYIGAGAAAAVAALALNALGAFKSERKVGGGLAGTLGSGSITPWEEWREGGTLFSGPSYETFNPIAELQAARAKLQKLQEASDNGTLGDPRFVTTQQMVVDQLERTYGSLVDSVTAQSKVIQDSYEAMRKSAGDMADILGISSEKVRQFTTALGGEKGINLEGLTAEQQQAKVAEALATANNELAQQVLGTWKTTTSEVKKTIVTQLSYGEDAIQSYETVTETINSTKYVASEYAKEGEKAIDTLTRLATSFSTVKDIAADLRIPFEQAGLSGAAAASKIADSFGGLQSMVEQLSSYMENYYTETERKQNLARRASEALSSVGLSVSQEDILGSSRSSVRKFVDGVIEQFGLESPQYVMAIKQANLLSGLYEPYAEGIKDVADAVDDSVEKMREAAAKLRSSLIGLESRFVGGGNSRQYQAQDAAQELTALLSSVGIAKDSSTLAGSILKATAPEIEDAFREIWGALDTDEAKQKLVDITSSIMDLAVSAETLSINIRSSLISLESRFTGGGKSRQYRAQDAAQELAALLSSAGIVKDASTLADSMLKATAPEVESAFSEIWGALNTDEAKQKLIDITNVMLDLAVSAESLPNSIRSSLIQLESRFPDGGNSRQYRAQDAAQELTALLSSIGIVKDSSTLADSMLKATAPEVQSTFREIWSFLDTDEAKQKLIDITNVMLDLAVPAESLSEKFSNQVSSLSKLASEVASIFDARNKAGNLLDRLSEAMGGKGSFQAQRENELWDALGTTTDHKKRVELASELTDLVLSRYQIEKSNAEDLLNFGKSLKNYVDNLKLGGISPLTNAEKLAEASRQYTLTLDKAKAGDKDAQGKLQGVSDSFLEIARTYYAGNEDFVRIFNSVTSSLENLGVSSISDAQQQIAIGQQSITELQKLYSLTEASYVSLNSEYESSLKTLAAAQDALIVQSKSYDQLVSITDSLSNLPAEISARLPAVDVNITLPEPNSGGMTEAEAAMIEELKALRLAVAKLEAASREDADKIAGATLAAAQANAEVVADATVKAARSAEVRQGAKLI